MTPSLVIEYISGVNICLKNKDYKDSEFKKIMKEFLEDYPKKALQISNMGQKQFDQIDMTIANLKIQESKTDNHYKKQKMMKKAKKATEQTET